MNLSSHYKIFSKISRTIILDINFMLILFSVNTSPSRYQALILLDKLDIRIVIVSPYDLVI